ncbi:MAG: DJ-1/PfpI family protein [Phycisphaeraceae bacterium]|nr:MAG: DJ-1/PfpI family protein [Phycisphaeraceae bacterium]
MADALILIAEGSEEIEAITPGDVLVRAGVAVTYAGEGALSMRGSRGLPLGADIAIGRLGDRLFDAVVIPGGMKGAQNLASSADVSRIVRAHAAAGKVIAAICAAPAVVLTPLGLLEGRRATCYPGLETRFGATTEHAPGDVVVDRTFITSRGPGTAMAFALCLAAMLAGDTTAEKVREGLLAAS